MIDALIGLAVILSLAIAATGCTSQTQLGGGGESGYFNLQSDAEGLRAWGESQVGIITEVKNPPEQKSAYWDQQNRNAEVRGLRFRRVERGNK